MSAAERRIAQLYLPQFEQFGLHLEPACGFAHVETENDIASGSGWVMPLSAHCLVVGHDVTPRRDMNLLEQTSEPYACVSEMNVETLSCMPENGITPGFLSPQSGMRSQETICTFVQSNLGNQYSPLRAGVTYRSRSILFLPGFFSELERQWPGEFSGMFEAFDKSWPDEALGVMAYALRQLSYPRVLRPGAYLRTRSTVDAMVADLACVRTEGRRAHDAQGARASAQLAKDAAALVERALDQGIRLGVDEAAASLFVSRSKLCAVFKSETGEGFAAYARRRRIERACELLADERLSITQIAAQLGYPRQSAFSQAFRELRGESPKAWRERCLK